MNKVLFIVPPKVHLLDINGPAHLFYEAKDYGASVTLHFVSMGDYSDVKSSAGLFFAQLISFQEFVLSTNDFIFIPGIDYSILSDVEFITKSKPFFEWLITQHANGAKLCSVCTGAFLLAETGLLDGKNCTTHWKYLDQFSTQFPAIKTLKNRLFVVQDRLYSSAGVSSGIDLSLYIIEELFGSKFAMDIAKEVVIYFRRGESDPQLSVFLQYRNHLDTRIHEAQDFMLQRLSTLFTLEDVAEKVNMSSRNFTRLFKKITSITVGAYLEKLRVERAVSLLSDQHKVDFVAAQCGLKSSNQLRALLKKHKGILPSDINVLTR